MADERGKVYLGKDYFAACRLVAEVHLGQTADEQMCIRDRIKRRLPFVDYKKIRLNTKQQTVKIPEGCAIDLGGVAKGYTSQKLADLLELEGVTSATVSYTHLDVYKRQA